MTTRVPQALQRLAALALLGLVLAVAWFAAARPLRAHLDAQAQAIERERILLGRFLAAGGRSATAGDMQGRINRVLGGAALLKGETDALRLAHLQTLVAEIAQAGNVQFRSVRVLPRREQGRFALLGVRVQATTTLATAQALIHRIENAETLLLISGLQLTQQGGNEGGPAQIELRLDLLGVAMKEAG